MLNLFTMKEQLKNMKSVRFMEDTARGVTIVCYMVDDPELWKHPLGLECRGSVFDTKTGKCLCRPFEKFFNFHEMSGEQKQEIIKTINSPVAARYFTKKRDGSMITPVLLPNGKLDFKTKKSFDSDVAKLAKEYIKTVPEFTKWCKAWCTAGYTPIFEFTHPDNEIVIGYGDKPTLTLLAVRNINSGHYCPLTFDHGIECEVISADYFESFLELENAQKEYEGEEGWVLELLDLKSLNSSRVKFKTQWYIDRHRLLDLRERDVADAVIEDKIDDLRESMVAAGADLMVLYEIQQRVVNELTGFMDIAVKLLDEAVSIDNSKKAVALFTMQHGKEFMPIIMALHEGNQSKAERNNKKLWEKHFREGYKLRSIVNSKFGDQNE